MASKWVKRISSANGGKFAELDVSKMQAAFRDFFKIGANSSEVVDMDKSTSSSSQYSMEDGDCFVRKEDLNQTVQELNQHHRSLLRTVNRFTARNASSWAATALSPNNSLVGIWVPQPYKSLLDGKWELTRKPSKYEEDENGRYFCDEDMWYVFEGELLDVAQKGGPALSKLYRKIFGDEELDPVRMKTLDTNHPIKVAMEQLVGK